MHNETWLYRIALTKIDKIGSAKAKNLISYCGSAEAVFKEKKSKLLKIPYIGELLAQSLTNTNVLHEAEKELEFIAKNQIRCFYYLDEHYPYRLKHIPDSPLILYYKGNADLNQNRMIAVVGTRRMSEYGQEILSSFIKNLKLYQVSIVSGLAYGVDAAAHRQCLIEEMETIGVLAHGLDLIYPPENKKLAVQMLERGGLLTEFPIKTKPDRERFPMRNRIVAGLTDATVVIETMVEGGSVITADLAMGYNRDVFAFPGRINDVMSAGTNALIKNQKAQLIESAADLAYQMKWDLEDQQVKPIQPSLFLELEENEKSLVDIIQQHPEVHVDVFYKNLSHTPSELASLLLGLEFKGVIRCLPGKRYSLTLR
ncbi:MAG: DNA-processing protein DprA [Bacteroidota bacterium]|nr:DNA-processing protein DprA [Bacteroidota bacterium]